MDSASYGVGPSVALQQRGGERYALLGISGQSPFLLIVRDGGCWPLLKPADRICSGARCSAGFDRRADLRTPRGPWRSQHRVGLQGKMGSGIDRSVSGSCDDHDAQLLVGERSGGGPRPDGALHEELIADRKRAFHFLLWFGSLELGCARSRLSGGSQRTRGRLKILDGLNCNAAAA